MNSVRVIELPHLEALCEEVSDHRVRFWIEKETKSRVWVGHDDGVQTTYALFPCFTGDNRTWVSLYVMRLIDEYYDAMDDQPDKVGLFAPLIKGPEVEKDRYGEWRPLAKYYYTEV